MREGEKEKESARDGIGAGGHYVDVIQKRECMLHLLKRLPRKIAVSRMATSPGAALLPSATVAGSYAAVIIIVPVLLQQAFELRRVYIQFVSRNYNLLGIGAADDAEESCPPFRLPSELSAIIVCSIELRLSFHTGSKMRDVDSRSFVKLCSRV